MNIKKIEHLKFCIKTETLRSFIFKLLLFLFVFGPFIRFGSKVLPLPYVIILLFSCLFFIILIYRSVNKKFFKYILLLGVSYFYIFLVSLFFMQFDRDIFLVFTTGIFMLMASYALAYLCNLLGGKDTISFFIKSVYKVTIYHAIIMILVFFIIPIRELLYSFVVLGENGELFLRTMTRSPGLTTAGGDALSIIQAIGLCFGIYYFFEIERKKTLYSFLKYLVGFIILTISILLSARSGLVIFMIFVVIFSFKRLIVFLVKHSINKRMAFRAVLISILLVSVLSVSYSIFINSEYNRFAKRAFELFVNYSERGEIRTSSTDDLSSMYFLPKSTLHLIFGNANFGRSPGLPGISSDVGYIRVIFGVGLLGLFIFYAPLLYPVFSLKKYSIFNHNGYFLLFFILIAILIVNFKVFHYFQFRESFKVFSILFALLCLNTKN